MWISEFKFAKPVLILLFIISPFFHMQSRNEENGLPNLVQRSIKLLVFLPIRLIIIGRKRKKKKQHFMPLWRQIMQPFTKQSVVKANNIFSRLSGAFKWTNFFQPSQQRKTQKLRRYKIKRFREKLEQLGRRTSMGSLHLFYHYQKDGLILYRVVQ